MKTSAPLVIFFMLLSFPGPIPTLNKICTGRGLCKPSCSGREYLTSSTSCHYPDHVYCCEKTGPTLTRNKKCIGRCKARCSGGEYVASTSSCHRADHVYCCSKTGAK